MMSATTPSVGVLWRIPRPQAGFQLVFAATGLNQAERYGDCLTDTRGHYELWEHWRTLSPRELKALGIPLEVKLRPYEHWPRGRVIYEIPPESFMLYADRRLHGSESHSHDY
jgi:hypothetical protein